MEPLKATLYVIYPELFQLYQWEEVTPIFFYLLDERPFMLLIIQATLYNSRNPFVVTHLKKKFFVY